MDKRTTLPPKCNQCDSATINGVYCHEHGCINTHKTWSTEEESWIDDEPEDNEWNEDYIEYYNDIKE